MDSHVSLETMHRCEGTARVVADAACLQVNSHFLWSQLNASRFLRVLCLLAAYFGEMAPWTIQPGEVRHKITVFRAKVNAACFRRHVRLLSYPTIVSVKRIIAREVCTYNTLFHSNSDVRCLSRIVVDLSATFSGPPACSFLRGAAPAVAASALDENQHRQAEALLESNGANPHCARDTGLFAVSLCMQVLLNSYKQLTCSG